MNLGHSDRYKGAKKRMHAIIRFSMKNGAALLIVIFALIGGGLYSVSNMHMEQYPKVDVPYLNIGIGYPGASPKQAMADIGVLVEPELRNLKGVSNVYTGAYPDGFWATVQFGLNVNMDEAEQAVRGAIAKLKLPDTALAPTYRKQQLDPEIYIFTVTGPDAVSLQKFADEAVMPALSRIHGIDRIDVKGKKESIINVKLKPEALQQYRLTYDTVQQMIKANSLSMPIGNLITTDQNLPIRVSSGQVNAEQLAALTLFAPNPDAAAAAAGKPFRTVQLKDIATITVESAESNIVRLNGENAVEFSIIPMQGEDAVTIANEAKKAVTTLAFPTGVSQQALLDRSQQVEQSVNSMLREVMLGALMAVIVTLLFLRNLRATLIAVISIPLSMLASFLVIKQLGYTLNMLTLAGIAVAIGRVVDDSIVVIENVFRRLRSSTERSADGVESATQEVATAITSSTLTTVAVFLPLAFVPGVVGKFFVPLAWTIVISLLFSLLVAVSIVPLLSRWFLLGIKHKESGENGLQQFYRGVLNWTLHHRIVTLTMAVLLLAGSLAIVGTGQLGFNFLPAEKSTTFSVQVSMPIGSNTKGTLKVTDAVESAIHQEADPVYIASSVNNENASVYFKLKEGVGDVDAVVNKLHGRLNAVQGAKSITLVGSGGIGVGDGYTLVVNGPNIEAIKSSADKMVEALKRVDGLTNVRSSAEGEKPEIVINLDAAKLADAGLTPVEVMQGLHQMVEGSTVTQTDLGGKTTDVKLSLQLQGNSTIDTLKEQKITTRLGTQLPLKELGTIQLVNNPTSITHLNGTEYMNIHGTFTSTNTGKVNSDAEAALRGLTLPAGVTWSSEGAAKEMQDGFVNMGIALLISIVLVYLVMVIAFSEAKLPLIILAAIPFSVIGAVIGLYIVHEPVGMPAMIGVLMLNGIVVTNAIVLLDKVKKNRLNGMGKQRALIEAGVTRIRPILMTAVATIGALLPLALSTESGLISRALAVVVIGGLTTSTMLTLIIVPVLYSLLMKGGRTWLEAAEEAPVSMSPKSI
jgi:multidrug efflux pump subunit AcrB